mgnify:CR=1 FL=1
MWQSFHLSSIQDFARASVIAYSLETTFMMLQLTMEAFRVKGGAYLFPSIFPFRPFILAEAASNVSVILALFWNDTWWWSVFSVICSIQIAGYLWSETSGEWAVLSVTTIFAPNALQYAPDAYLFLCAILVLNSGRMRSQEMRQALTAVSQVGSWMLMRSGHIIPSYLLAGIGAEMAIVSLHYRITGPPPTLSSDISRPVHAFLLYVCGIRYTDSESWHRHVPNTPSCLPDDLKGCTWRCESRSIVARRVHSSVCLEVEEGEEVIMLPFYWQEVAFAPTLRGCILCLLTGLRLPITVRATISNRDGERYLRQTEILVFGIVLPRSISTRFENGLLPGERCPTVKAVLTPTRLTLRRVTEVMLTLSLFEYMNLS